MDVLAFSTISLPFTLSVFGRKIDMLGSKASRTDQKELLYTMYLLWGESMRA